VVELSTIYNYLVEVEGQLQDGFIDHWAAGSQMNRTVVRGVPKAESAPTDLAESYPQPTAQPVDNWQRSRAWRRKADPPLLNSARAVPVLPNKKYLLK